jgi:large subunit ribosomal protein L18
MSSLNFKRTRTKSKVNYSKHVLVICRSNKYIQAQILEPLTKNTLATFSTKSLKKGTKSEKSFEIGIIIADFLSKQKIDTISFDRNGLLFTGRVKSLADGVRSKNITI